MQVLFWVWEIQRKKRMDFKICHIMKGETIHYWGKTSLSERKIDFCRHTDATVISSGLRVALALAITSDHHLLGGHWIYSGVLSYASLGCDYRNPSTTPSSTVFSESLRSGWRQLSSLPAQKTVLSSHSPPASILSPNNFPPISVNGLNTI